VSEPAHIAEPPEATWVSEWEFFKGSCGHQYWIRYFGAGTWTVETSAPDPVEVRLGGSQFSDGSIELWICLDGHTCGLEVDEALTLAATLSRAAEELERIQGSSL
jgi:hypothetical protein